MKYINKTIFINYLRCPTLGWMTKRNMILKSRRVNNRFLKFERKIIKKMSQHFFSNAISAWGSKTDIGALYTKELILNPNVKTICEASFVADAYLAKVDVLKKCDNNLLSLFEVKSATKYKFKYINDISFDAMVLAKASVNVQKYLLLYLSNDYRFGMDVSKFFKVLDCTEKVELKTNEFLNLSDEIFEVIKSKNMPEPYLKKNCKNCLVFNTCIGKSVKNHIFDLPRLSTTSIEKLITLGVDTICKIPSDFELTKVQKIVKNCVLTGINYISENLETHIHSIKQPFYYLDFESVSMAAIPLCEYIGPHTQFLTQFSIDKTDIAGNILDHYESILLIPKKTVDVRLRKNLLNI
jgi:CRISPR/Cas system-associated exonuclease Cas4 (RecB family)